MYSAVFLKEQQLMLIIATLTGEPGGIDLSSCTGLKTLVLSLTPRFSMDTHSGLVIELLASWKPQHSGSDLRFRADRQELFTRRGFADVLRGLGTITEAWLQTVEEPPPEGESGNNHHVEYKLRVHIHDREAEKNWWSHHLKSCFPTWLKLRRLRLSIHAREYTSNGGGINLGVDL